MDVARYKTNIKSIARPTLFEIIITGSNVQSIDQELFKFTCKAASLPNSTIGVIELPYFGRKIKLAGDRTYQEWQTTLIGVNSFGVYNQLEEWHRKINHPSQNVMSTDDQNQYKADAFVRCFSETGIVTKELKLIGVWPSDIQQVDLAWDQNDSTMDITVSWSFDYIE